MKLSAVVNTWNEQENIRRCLNSLISWVYEVVIVDMESTDKTTDIARKMGAKVFSHQYEGYVEPARNFAIGKTSGNWILILDADEEIPIPLRETIVSIINKNSLKTFYRLPRKNIAFGKWIKHGLWWPDHQIRLFQKGYVEWREEIHSVPYTRGEGIDLEAKEKYAIVHHNYQSIDQFVKRLNRYTTRQAKEKQDKHEIFNWKMVVKAPMQEFLRRYFLADGYKDGLHGLILGLIQSFSELIVQIKLWELNGFTEVSSTKIRDQLPRVLADESKEFHHWLVKKEFVANFTTKLRQLLS